MKFSVTYFSVSVTNADLVTFTEEIINDKLQFSCTYFRINAWSIILEKKSWAKIKKNKENLTRAENFYICCFVIFDWRCQKLISGSKTKVYAVLSFNFEIILILSTFLAYWALSGLPYSRELVYKDYYTRYQVLF